MGSLLFKWGIRKVDIKYFIDLILKINKFFYFLFVLSLNKL